MKYAGIVLGGIAVILASVALYFATSTKLKVAYVNSTEVLNAYKGMADLRKEMQAAEKMETAKMDTLLNSFKIALSDYDKSKASMTANEVKLKEELLNLKRQQISGYQQSVQEKLRAKDVKLNSALVTDINSFIDAYASQRGYDLIIGATNMGNVVYANETLDISEEVTKELNNRYQP